MKLITRLLSLAAVVSLASCGKDEQSTGTEFASQMYHSIAYEPYSQIRDTANEDYNSNPYNQYGMNMRKPAKGSISRKQFAGTARTVLASDIMEYNIPSADSMDWSSRNLICPYPASTQVLEDGKVLYTQFCSPCHGAEGKGNGKVADMYKGVPSYSVGRVATVSEGHIYHTITYGKGRMWPHGSQVNPDERWKIVRYVQTLQKAQ